MDISVIILVHEMNVEKCFNSAKRVSKDIIFVTNNRDESFIGYLKRLSPRVIIRDFDNYANQKNAGIKHAKCGWVLNLDSDEVLSERLIKEIHDLNAWTEDAFSLRFKTQIFDKMRDQNERHIRIFKKEFVFSGEVHEKIRGIKEVRVLDGYVMHYCWKGFDEWVLKLRKYAKMRAVQDAKADRYPLFAVPFMAVGVTLFNFLEGYFYRGRIFWGVEGFIYSLAGAVNTVYRFGYYVETKQKKKD